MDNYLNGFSEFHSADMNVDNEFIPGYSKTKDILNHGGPRKGGVSLFLEKISQKYESFSVFYPV